MPEILSTTNKKLFSAVDKQEESSVGFGEIFSENPDSLNFKGLHDDIGARIAKKQYSLLPQDFDYRKARNFVSFVDSNTLVSIANNSYSSDTIERMIVGSHETKLKIIDRYISKKDTSPFHAISFLSEVMVKPKKSRNNRIIIYRPIRFPILRAFFKMMLVTFMFILYPIAKSAFHSIAAKRCDFDDFYDNGIASKEEVREAASLLGSHKSKICHRKNEKGEVVYSVELENSSETSPLQSSDDSLSDFKKEKKHTMNRSFCYEDIYFRDLFACLSKNDFDPDTANVSFLDVSFKFGSSSIVLNHSICGIEISAIYANDFKYNKTKPEVQSLKRDKLSRVSQDNVNILVDKFKQAGLRVQYSRRKVETSNDEYEYFICVSGKGVESDKQFHIFADLSGHALEEAKKNEWTGYRLRNDASKLVTKNLTDSFNDALISDDKKLKALEYSDIKFQFADNDNNIDFRNGCYVSSGWFNKWPSSLYLNSKKSLSYKSEYVFPATIDVLDKNNKINFMPLFDAVVDKVKYYEIKEKAKLVYPDIRHLLYCGSIDKMRKSLSGDSMIVCALVVDGFDLKKEEYYMFCNNVDVLLHGDNKKKSMSGFVLLDPLSLSDEQKKSALLWNRESIYKDAILIDKNGKNVASNVFCNIGRKNLHSCEILFNALRKRSDNACVSVYRKKINNEIKYVFDVFNNNGEHLYLFVDGGDRDDLFSDYNVQDICVLSQNLMSLSEAIKFLEIGNIDKFQHSAIPSIDKDDKSLAIEFKDNMEIFGASLNDFKLVCKSDFFRDIDTEKPSNAITNSFVSPANCESVLIREV